MLLLGKPGESDSTTEPPQWIHWPMYWRLIRQFLLWGPGAFGAAYLAVLGIAAAAAAAANNTAKSFLDGQIEMVARMVTAAYFPLYLVGVIVVWLGAYLWSEHKAHTYERSLNPSPPERQERKAPEPSVLRRSGAAPLSSLFGSTRLQQGLVTGLHRGLEEARAERLEKLKRDATLSKAIVFACTGSWERDPVEVRFTVDDVEVFEEVEKEFEQLAKDGEITVWGKERVADIFSTELWQKIDSDFWTKNRVKWASLILDGGAVTEPRRPHGSDNQFEDLMVSKFEFEKAFSGPKPLAERLSSEEE